MTGSTGDRTYLPSHASCKSREMYQCPRIGESDNVSLVRSSGGKRCRVQGENGRAMTLFLPCAGDQRRQVTVSCSIIRSATQALNTFQALR